MKGPDDTAIFQVFFDFNKADLTTAAHKTIADAAARARAGHAAELTVIGHADTVGSQAYNQTLSEHRAAAVKSELVADGIAEEAITATGAGKMGLLVATGDGVREPQNRRAEITEKMVAAAAPPLTATAATPAPAPAPAAGCTGTVDPYKNYACLDTYLGTGFFERFANYYTLEMGQAAAPSDPNAPPGRRDNWPKDPPESTPPMPFTEWPYGGTTPIGVTRTGSVDSPLMAALGNTGAGQWLNDTGIQLYGWVDGGFNVSTNTRQPGNAPISYSYTPNTVQLDQAVLYVDRFPDTVQSDHVDWGMRLSAIYGENYRYTFSYSPFTSAEYLKHNNIYGYDFPMVYGEIFVPQVAEGLMIRFGRYISLPDIEAQLAPNNYMYSHSLTYSFDNYTNEGIQGTLAISPDLMLQLGVSVGTEAWFNHLNANLHNPDPNPLYPANYYKKDPGAVPSLTACFRYTWNDGDDNLYPCMNSINDGGWGYNNLNWYGTTYYHRFSDQWHLSFEFYDMKEHGVPNLNNVNNVPGVPGGVPAIIAAGGTPFSPQNVPYNAPDAALCQSAAVLRCTTTAIGILAYLNYQLDPLDNLSFRPEFYEDQQGQRTGTKTNYYEITLGWQHWLSPQIELRPEIGYYRSIDAKAFNGDSAAGIAPDRDYTVIGSADLILHY